MDKVFIEGLEVDALIGIYDWERRVRQMLCFDLEMGFDNRPPAASDDIVDALDYKAISKRLIEVVQQSDYGLVGRWPSIVPRYCLLNSTCSGCV